MNVYVYIYRRSSARVGRLFTDCPRLSTRELLDMTSMNNVSFLMVSKIKLMVIVLSTWIATVFVAVVVVVVLTLYARSVLIDEL